MPDISVRGVASAARAVALAVAGALLVLLVVIEREYWKWEVETLARSQGIRHAKDSFRRGDDRMMELVEDGAAGEGIGCLNPSGKADVWLLELPPQGVFSHFFPYWGFGGVQRFSTECYVDAYNETKRELKSSPDDEESSQPRGTESAT